MTTTAGIRARSRRPMAGIAAIGVAGVLGLTALPAGAAGPLDQTEPDGSSNCQGFGAGLMLAQTFTAGVTGNLDAASVSIARVESTTAPVTVEIRNTVPFAGDPGDQPRPGQPGDTVLATASIPASAVALHVTGFVTVDVPPAPVVAGTTYAIVLTTDAAQEFPPPYCVGGNDDNSSYHGGDALAQPPGGPWITIPIGIQDFGFETYVTPAPPPPPPPAQPNGLISGLLGAVTAILPPLAPVVNPIRNLLGLLHL